MQAMLHLTHASQTMLCSYHKTYFKHTAARLHATCPGQTGLDIFLEFLSILIYRHIVYLINSEKRIYIAAKLYTDLLDEDLSLRRQ